LSIGYSPDDPSDVVYRSIARFSPRWLNFDQMVLIVRSVNFSLILLVLGAVPTRADSIYMISDSPHDTPTPLCLGGGCFSQVLMASWSSLVAYDNVSIFAEVGADNSSASLTAYLTTQIGLGTTAANQIASVTLTPQAYDSPALSLFSGLNLGPGTYYLVLSGPATETSFSYWYQYSSPATYVAAQVSAGSFGMANVADSSSSVNTSYAPASVLDLTGAPSLSIEVVGTVAPPTAPEPGSTWLLVGGLFLLGLGRLQRTAGK
jgi:hypothetical protein